MLHEDNKKEDALKLLKKVEDESQIFEFGISF